MGMGLTLIGLILLAGWSLPSVKLVLILGFMLLTGPTATHALAKAALHGRLDPLSVARRAAVIERLILTSLFACTE